MEIKVEYFSSPKLVDKKLEKQGPVTMSAPPAAKPIAGRTSFTSARRSTPAFSGSCQRLLLLLLTDVVVVVNSCWKLMDFPPGFPATNQAAKRSFKQGEGKC